MTVRTLLTAPTAFYCNPTTGSLSNNGLSAAAPLPQPQDVINVLQSSYDLGGQPVDIHGADGQLFDGFGLSGLLVGQRGPHLTFHCGSAPGLSAIVPRSTSPVLGAYGVALSYGAMMTFNNLEIDSTQQIGTGSIGNDCIALGQGARASFTGTLKLIQGTLAFNHMTLDSNCTVDLQPGVQMHFAGRAQCGIQLDAASAFQVGCNFIHGIIAMWADYYAGAWPYWADAFVDVAGASKALLAGADLHGTGLGYKYRIREGGCLDLNLANDPGQLTALFGSAATAWPVDGYLV